MKVREDWIANKGNPKGRFIMVFFRMVNFLRRYVLLWPFYTISHIIYKLLLDWLMGVDIPIRTKIGKGCKIFHGHTLVINADTEIGNYCVLRHCTTLGNKKLPDGTYSKGPRIGNNCDLGAHVIVLGHVEIGDNCVVGAGSIITKDIPNNSLAYGNPLLIKSIK